MLLGLSNNSKFKQDLQQTPRLCNDKPGDPQTLRQVQYPCKHRDMYSQLTKQERLYHAVRCEKQHACSGNPCLGSLLHDFAVQGSLAAHLLDGLDRLLKHRFQRCLLLLLIQTNSDGASPLHFSAYIHTYIYIYIYIYLFIYFCIFSQRCSDGLCN